MKNLKLFSYLLIIVSTSIFTSCTPESLDYRSTAREFISGGKWSVDYYFAGQDKTTQFNSYHFSFIGNGTVTATSSNGSINGTWSIVRDVNRNEVLQMNLQEPHLQDLNEQWVVTGTAIELLVMKGTGSELRLRRL